MVASLTTNDLGKHVIKNSELGSEIYNKMHRIFGNILNEFNFLIKHVEIVPMCIYHVVLGCIANPLI